MKLPFNIDLSGKVAVVTGGGGILCGAFAKALGQCGARVAILDLAFEAAQKVADEIKADGGEAIAVETNILKRESLIAALDEVTSEMDICDILVNGAGGNHPKGTSDKEMITVEDIKESLKGSFFDFETSGLEFVFALNYIGTINVSQVFGEQMVKSGKGSIINISSMSSFHPLTKVMAYSNAKAAVNNFTEWLAVHLGPTGVRVNAIAPGFFLTAQNHKLLMGDNNTPTERCAKILNNTPMGRLGVPGDLIGALLFLASEEASGFVTGTNMVIDGGFNSYSGV